VTLGKPSDWAWPLSEPTTRPPPVRRLPCLPGAPPQPKPSAQEPKSPRRIDELEASFHGSISSVFSAAKLRRPSPVLAPLLLYTGLDCSALGSHRTRVLGRAKRAVVCSTSSHLMRVVPRTTPDRTNRNRLCSKKVYLLDRQIGKPPARLTHHPRISATCRQRRERVIGRLPCSNGA
jgi:hypothetical protein